MTNPTGDALKASVAQMRVEPLEWNRDDDMASVQISVAYYLERRPGYCALVTMPTGERIGREPFPSVEEAKAAAQADYEARIRAALSVEQAPQPVVDEIIEAAMVAAEVPEEERATVAASNIQIEHMKRFWDETPVSPSLRKLNAKLLKGDFLSLIERIEWEAKQTDIAHEQAELLKEQLQEIIDWRDIAMEALKTAERMIAKEWPNGQAVIDIRAALAAEGSAE